MNDWKKAPVMTADDVDDGLRHLQGLLSKGMPGIFLGTGPGGFALLVGHTKVSSMVGGVVLGFPMTRANLVQLRDRCDELLEGKADSKPLVIV